MYMEKAGSVPNKPGNPLWLLAEITYKCPLHCVFCYNPVDYTTYGQELSTEDWLRVLRQGREIGATQLGFSGGEPLVRDDLEILVAEARKLGYYSNLITSGVGLNEKRISAFKEGGLDHIQLSFQDSTKELNDFLSSTRTFDLKQKVAKLIKQYDYPMVLNCVLHRHNIDHVQQILEMAEAMQAEYVELANTQYYGWAYVNRDQLLPTREQLPGLTFPNVRDHDLRSIWYDSPGFNAYRGDAWMKEPCRTCPEKVKDFGGCRCQAYMLTGDPANADPVCDKSPHHALVTQAVERAQQARAPVEMKPVLFFRDDRNSRALSRDRGREPVA
jgi:pyrroloquinoline quinone biosynthesis protein E